MREALEVGDHHRIVSWRSESRINWVHIGEIGRRKTTETRRNSIQRTGSQTRNTRPVGTLRRIGTLIHHHAVPEGICRNHAQRAMLLPLPEAFVVGKEEQAVLDNGAAHRRTENIADEFLRSVAFSRCELRLFYKVIVGAG